MACEATRADSEYEWKDAAVALAASNERLCRIALAADELAKAIENHGERHFAIRAALDAYKITRNGQ